jgi:phasin family protein
MSRTAKSKAKSAPPRRRSHIEQQHTETFRADERTAESTPAERTADTIQHEPQSQEQSRVNTIEGAQLAQQNSEKIFGATRERVEMASQTAFKAFEDLQKLSKENIEAYVQASTIVAKGFEQVGKAWLALTQEALEQSATAAKALLGTRSLREAVELQTEFAKTSFEKFVTESTKLSEQTVKTANEALEPINARFTVAVEKLWKPLAA